MELFFHIYIYILVKYWLLNAFLNDNAKIYIYLEKGESNFFSFVYKLGEWKHIKLLNFFHNRQIVSVLYGVVVKYWLLNAFLIIMLRFTFIWKHRSRQLFIYFFS